MNVNDELKVEYCIPLWLRDEQIKQAIKRPIGRIGDSQPKRDEPIALVSYGPSLADTWEQIKDFKYVMTCSGAHKFLVERGIIPNWHIEVDPRAHKVDLIGPPQKETEYLIASACHAKVFDHLEGFNVKLWHVFSNGDDAARLLPRDEWAITGGASVGLRTLTMARYLGFTNLHIFGMDGSEGATGKHAAFHPNQPKSHQLVEYPEGSGKMWKTTASMLQCARTTWHELDMLKDCKATFYGEGLVQEMAKHYVPKPVESDVFIAMNKPSLISSTYREMNAKLHADRLDYGVSGQRYVSTVLKLAKSINSNSILDYGCGKGMLAKGIDFPIWEYDPAIPGKDELPRPAQLVVCTDVLEHIEPECLAAVLDDLARVTQKIGYFVIHTGPAGKTLADGRNAHLIQESEGWWRARLENFFQIGKIIKSGPELHVIVSPKVALKKAA